MNRDEIIGALQRLIDSAKRRGIDQGVRTYTTFIEEFGRCTEEEIPELLAETNRNLSGILAHGTITNDEYRAISFLDELERRIRNGGETPNS